MIATETVVALEDTFVRLLCRALRHHPEEFGAELDEAGWTAWRPLWEVVRHGRSAWSGLSFDMVTAALLQRQAQRFEWANGRIRARYGHSVAGVLVACIARPPDLLYHGTGAVCVPLILKQGLLPMGRSHAHLTASLEYAWSVARTALGRPTVFEILARRAEAEGVRFLRSGEHVWLADSVPAEFVRVCTATTHAQAFQLHASPR